MAMTNAERNRKWRESNPKRYRELQRKWRAENREHYRAYHREYTERYRQRLNFAATARRYGLNAAQLHLMYERQEYRCAICRKEKKLTVDHCHRTGAVRELLCQSCNNVLGNMQDNTQLLQAAIDYIERHNVRNLS